VRSPADEAHLHDVVAEHQHRLDVEHRVLEGVQPHADERAVAGASEQLLPRRQVMKHRLPIDQFHRGVELPLVEQLIVPAHDLFCCHRCGSVAGVAP
jgi:hypothetical protein